MLPPGVRWLELAVPCAGPLLPALVRFSHLQCLAIAGNGADILWTVGPSTALAPLQHLCLDYRHPPWENRESQVGLLPFKSRGLMALAAAAALHTLELRLIWSADVAALCHMLPALHHLRCGRVGSLVIAMQLW